MTKSASHRTRGDARRWSARVTKHSNALDLDHGVFAQKDPHRIALSLKRSAERSHRRKSDPYRSAMSMLTFYINRAGDNLGARQRRVLERAKDELRRVFGRDSEPGKRRRTARGHRKRASSRRRRRRPEAPMALASVMRDGRSAGASRSSPAPSLLSPCASPA